MRSRTRVITASAAIAAALAGTTAAAMAATPGARPAVQAAVTKSIVQDKVPGDAKCVTAGAAAAKLGVTPDRLSQAMRAVKESLRASGQVTPGQFEAAAARKLGVSQARMHQALAASSRYCPAKPIGPQGQPGVTRAVGNPGADAAKAQAAMVAVVARELHVSTAQADAALRSIFAAGYADPQSASFAAAARSLGVSTQRLAAALMDAKQSMASASPAAGQVPGK